MSIFKARSPSHHNIAKAKKNSASMLAFVTSLDQLLKLVPT